MKILIVTPESAAVPLGNSITANRWAGILRDIDHDVDVRNGWGGEDCDLLIALHALRSAESIMRFRLAHPLRPLIVALTGTDLYRDLSNSSVARQSLGLSTRIVALQECALDELDEALSAKTVIIYQSSVPSTHRHAPSDQFFDVCVLSHLRILKDPLRAAYAARLLAPASRIRILHAGRVLEPEFETLAREEARVNPRYHRLGEQSHDEAMQLLGSSRLAVISSSMEGGANAIAEAIVHGIPVLCSRIPGNVGMLGADYAGYFALQNTSQLTRLLERAEFDAGYLASLQEFVRKMQDRFRPEREIDCWKHLLETVTSSAGNL